MTDSTLDDECDAALWIDFRAVSEGQAARRKHADHHEILRKLLRAELVIHNSRREDRHSLQLVDYWDDMEDRCRRALQALNEGCTETARLFADGFKPKVIVFKSTGFLVTSDNVVKAFAPAMALTWILLQVGAPLIPIVVLTWVGAVMLARRWSADALKPPPEIPLDDPDPWVQDSPPKRRR
ncbi:MAG TPA: hypothetical protein VF272_02105 [Candidatus Saccharimonadia bacterium]